MEKAREHTDKRGIFVFSILEFPCFMLTEFSNRTAEIVAICYSPLFIAL
jgi:hypothetical protein